MVNSEFGAVFTPEKIGTVKIENRIVRSATYTARASLDGYVTDDLLNTYSKLAEGGVGLTITGVTNVREDGRQLAKMLANYSDDYLDGLARLAGTYHDSSKEVGNNSKIFLQIGHCGSQSTHWGTETLVSSSEKENVLLKKVPKKLTIEEIQELIELFSEATLRAKKAGFDGAQYHGAHGYLITQFYSPYLNNRDDEYGGSTENRARFILEILKLSKKKTGFNFPINLKMNASDKITEGLEINEACELALLFAENGFDSLEISSYIHEAGIHEKPVSLPPETQINLRKRNLKAYNLDYAVAIKEYLKNNSKKQIPLILVGGIYDFNTIKTIIEEKGIKFCSMSRPFIRQPNLVNLWKAGPPFEEAKCIHCNLCTADFLRRGPKSKGVRCIAEEREQRKKRV